MAQAVIGSIRVNLGLDSAQFARGAKRVDAPLKRMQRQFTRIASVAAVMGAAISAAALAGAKQIDQAAKSARRLDASIGGFRALELAASEAGVSLSGLTNDIQTMNRELASIGTSGNGKRALDALGLTIDDLEGKDADEKLAVIADQVKALGLSAGETTAVLRDLGIRNREMALLVLSGGDAIRSARGDIQEYGLAISAVDAGRIETANDQIGRLGLITQYAGQQLAISLVPAMGAFAEAMTNSLREGGLLRAIIDGLVVAAGGFGDALAGLSVAIIALTATQIPAAIAGLVAYTAGMSAAGVATGILTAAIRVARVALIALGGPLGIIYGLVGAASAAFFIFRDNAGELETAAYDAEAGSLALAAALAEVATAEPASSAAVIALANNNVKLADSAYEAARAELAKRRAMLSELETAGGGGRRRRLDTSAAQRAFTDANNDLIASEEALAIAMQDRLEVSEEIAMSMPTVVAGTEGLTTAAEAAAAAAEALADEIGGATPATAKLEKVLTETEIAAIAAAEALDNQLSTAVDSLASAFGDFVTSGFQDFKGMMDSILSSFKSMISQMIATAVANPIKIALGIGGGAGAAGAAGGLGGAVQGMIGSAIGGLGNALSGGIGNLFNVGANAAAAGGGLMATLGAVAPMLGIAAAAFSFFRKKTTELDAGLRVSVGLDTLVESFKTIETSRFFGLSKKVNDQFEELSDAASAPLRKVISDIQTSVLGGAAALGIAADAFDGFSTQITLSTKGLSEEEATAAMVDALKGVADEFANMIPELAGLQREGEGAFDTLQRLGTSLSATNAVFDMLGLGLIDMSIAGAQASTAFTDIFGSIENLNAASNAYFSRFFSDAEQSAFMTEQVGSALASLGEIMPKTTDGFRALVEQARAINDIEAVGQLIALAPAFAAALDASKALMDAATQRQASIDSEKMQIQTQMLQSLSTQAGLNLNAANDNFTKATTDLKDTFSNEMDATRDAFQTTIDGLNDDLTGARERLSTSKSIADALSSALNRRLFPSVEAQRQSQDAAAGYLASLVGKEITDEDALTRALGIVADPSTDTYKTLSAYRRDFGITSGVISALEKTAGFALSADEQAVNLLQAQLENTQLQSETEVGLLEAQLNGILGLSTNLMSLSDAIGGFASAQASQKAATAAATAATEAVANISLGPIEQIYKDVLGRTADAVGLAFFRTNLAEGKSSIDQIRANIAGSPEAMRRVPSFSGGGYTGNGARSGGLDGSGGFLSMLHPQETVTDHTRGGVNSGIEAQLDRLNARVEQLTAYSKQTTINTGNASFDLKDIRRNGVQVEPVEGSVFYTKEVA
jgi:hypothetical protein